MPVAVEPKCVVKKYPQPAHVKLPSKYHALNSGYTVDSEKLECTTRKQAECEEWREARSSRLTSSNFGNVLKRKAPPTAAFMKTLFNNTEIHAPSLDYGRRHEAQAKAQYLKTFPSRHIHECGLVVNNEFSFLGASPDGKVCDSGLCGILEIKCPYTARNITIKEACKQIPRFMLDEHDSNGILLKRDHSYYCQIQGQLMITGADFCDFTVFTKKDIYVERIFPDVQYMERMIDVLANFFMQYAKPYLNNV